jgi:hypothetical protein
LLQQFLLPGRKEVDQEKQTQKQAKAQENEVRKRRERPLKASLAL